jgi:ABC-type branched-subunit amino acid transport system substrate-binding protein
MQKTRIRRVGALLVGLSMLAAACGSDDDEAAEDTTETTAAPAEETTAAPETTAAAEEEEATTTAAAAAEGDAETAGALEGLKGTTPLVELSDDFTSRVAEMPSMAGEDFNYAGETYDAFVIIAMAAEKAGTDGIAMASEIVGITRDGEKCTDYASCLEIIKAGGDPDYDGITGPITMNGNGEPLEASYGVLQMGADNRLDPALTTYVPITSPASAEVELTPVEGTREGDGVLTFGGILPQTGSLAFLGPPEFAGAELAVEDINAAGGVLGQPIVWIPGDSGDTSTDTASVTVDRLLAENVDAIIGAASSSVSLTVIDKITSAGVVQFSPANTSNALSEPTDKGLYFRTAPPDTLQGAVVSQLVIDDGASSAYILALDDAYGTSLATVAQETLEAAGLEVTVKIYDPKATSFDAEVGEIKAAAPDALVLISFDEASRILRTLVENELGPTNLPTYGVDGFISNTVGENFDGGK